MINQGEPSFIYELKRGLNAYNLTVGLLSSTLIAIILFLLIYLQIIPFDLQQPVTIAILSGGVLFLTTTFLHTAVHCYFGWRFSRGIRAHRHGDHQRAIRLLTPVTWAGMQHYDEKGFAAKYLQKSLSVIS